MCACSIRYTCVDAGRGRNVVWAFDYTFTCGEFEAKRTWAHEDRADGQLGR